ncbi:preprotein translocase subunit SecE [Candidatus Azambacteria bacterium RIFCSPHIGHO2_01_FULL_44_55]|uniref:Protein translocase subunit SecE n=1 Tax=Candidatus Azambacteria bacterium RIFCSPLOWO2_02_FULL_44_14 TaxID=1797306 RepID=A0A1F5CCI4_9BACT|nr:MAG: preprotein translocase subunit SecE [Candidatus Azambacteria bacterium RIFCSPHIGHO2_02_FULL_45_18]OGD40125.1 MAG: preprotein translocase subunit SecE [Candidatus Azambacteria bacterium RIFCSPHIGHO2_01_FULL_44_55]OGD40572.1 MAG: preprotein translocase subunit SecE [Candidatus Azambacteria bacterium RIFCSPLOWO2_02_FULL_44_14]OGD49974.1 MAG: preprotein translocase subunit SecE [Candidatus Azambacteria bacterium RIFOXYD1_FULL_44_10]
MNYTERIKNYFREVRVEMAKVNWPTRSQTVNYTLIVIFGSVAVALFLSAFDLIFTYLVNLLILR